MATSAQEREDGLITVSIPVALYSRITSWRLKESAKAGRAISMREAVETLLRGAIESVAKTPRSKKE